MIKLEKYRDIWLSEKMNEVIGFYPREFYPLDNFSSFKVEWNGYLYASLEEAYQAASFIGSDEETVEKIKKSHSADEAKRIAHENREKRRQDGGEYLQGNRNAFVDHPEFACKIWGTYNQATKQVCGGN